MEIEPKRLDQEGLSQSQHHKHSRKDILMCLAAICSLVAIVCLGYYLLVGRFSEYTDDAYVKGNLVQLMPQITGTIIKINTDDTQYVTVGQMLIELDPSNTDVALQQARAELAQTIRQVRKYYADAEQAEALVRQRKVNLNNARADLNRRTGLVSEKAISQEELDHVITAVATAQADFNIALQQLKSAYALVNNTHLYQHPLVESAKAKFKSAYLDSLRTRVSTPVAGFVAKRSAQIGQRITPGTPLLAIIPLHEIWIEANFKETQLERIRIDQPVTMTSDANGITYHGKVVGLSAGTGSTFALLPPQNATGNWIKIVQRLPVRIALNKNEIVQHPLQLGLSMRVSVNTHKTKGHMLASATENKPVYETRIYESQLAQANKLIEQIVHANAPMDIYFNSNALQKGSV